MPVLNYIDWYKGKHGPMYPEHTTKIFDGFTPRKSRVEGVDTIIYFGMQYWIKKYLIKKWKKGFFDQPIEKVIKKYKRRVEASLGKDAITYDHLRELHKLGYMPLSIWALPEGSTVGMKVTPMVMFNTHPVGFWIPNYLETIMSCSTWQSSTSATLAREFRKEFNRAAIKTTGSTKGVNFQGHDFSFRGMSSLESAKMSGAGHLLYFDGTDTVPAIDFLEKYYNADQVKEKFGMSIAATEHSVMCMGTKDDELGTFRRLLKVVPKGGLGIVSDTWDLWKVLTVILPQLKDEILARDGFISIRPDSGDPVDIMCGTNFNSEGEYCSWIKEETPEQKGVIELLWDVFGGTTNEQGYKVLDPHITAIYGDSINITRAKAINNRLEAKGFASINWTAGIGSYTYQYNTRDTFGWAMKATFGELTLSGVIKPREIFKDPITDDGMKKSAKGLIAVYGENGSYTLKDQATWDEVFNCAYQRVYENGKLLIDQKFSDIRKLANSLI